MLNGLTFFQKIPLKKLQFDDHLIPPPPISVEIFIWFHLKRQLFYGKQETVPGECSGDIFLSLDFPPSGNRLIFSNKGGEKLKALNYIYSIRKVLIKKAKHVDHLL